MRPSGAPFPEQGGPSEATAYATAMAAAREAVTARAAQYKWLVIAMVMLCATSLASAAVWRDWRPLVILSLLPCVVLIFFAMDGVVVHRWRAGILAAWRTGGMELDILSQTLRRVPGLPTGTLDGMLDCLPRWATGEAPAQRMRLVLSDMQSLLGRVAAERLFGRAMGFAVAAGVLCITAIWRSPLLLLWLLAVPCLMLPFGLWRTWRVRRAHALAARACRDAGFEERAYRKWFQGLDWQGIPLTARLPTRPPE